MPSQLRFRPRQSPLLPLGSPVPPYAQSLSPRLHQMMSNPKGPSQQQQLQCAMLGLLLQALMLVGQLQRALAHLSIPRALCLKVRGGLNALSCSCGTSQSCLQSSSWYACDDSQRYMMTPFVSGKSAALLMWCVVEYAWCQAAGLLRLMLPSGS